MPTPWKYLRHDGENKAGPLKILKALVLDLSQPSEQYDSLRIQL